MQLAGPYIAWFHQYMRTSLVLSSLALLSFQLFAQQRQGWRYLKEDPKTKKHVVEIDAKSFDQTPDGRTQHLHDMTARLYDANGVTFKQITSKEAVMDEKSGTLAYGPDLKTIVKLTNPKS
jgi:hypothetical protein